MLEQFISTALQLSPHSGLGLVLLIVGALFTAAVGVSITSFYLDDYWQDEDYRDSLRYGQEKANRKKRQKI